MSEEKSKKVKIKPLKLVIKNFKGTSFNARKIKCLEGKLPMDMEIVRRYAILQQMGAEEFDPFILRLDKESSHDLAKHLQQDMSLMEKIVQVTVDSACVLKIILEW